MDGKILAEGNIFPDVQSFEKTVKDYGAANSVIFVRGDCHKSPRGPPGAYNYINFVCKHGGKKPKCSSKGIRPCQSTVKCGCPVRVKANCLRTPEGEIHYKIVKTILEHNHEALIERKLARGVRKNWDYTEDDIQAAVKAVRDGSLTQKDAAKVYGMSDRVLRLHLHNKSFRMPLLPAIITDGSRLVLNRNNIVKWFKEMAKKGFDREQLFEHIRKVAEDSDISLSEETGETWVECLKELEKSKIALEMGHTNPALPKKKTFEIFDEYRTSTSVLNVVEKMETEDTVCEGEVGGSETTSSGLIPSSQESSGVAQPPSSFFSSTPLNSHLRKQSQSKYQAAQPSAPPPPPPPSVPIPIIIEDLSPLLALDRLLDMTARLGLDKMYQFRFLLLNSEHNKNAKAKEEGEENEQLLFSLMYTALSKSLRDMGSITVTTDASCVTTPPSEESKLVRPAPDTTIPLDRLLDRLLDHTARIGSAKLSQFRCAHELSCFYSSYEQKSEPDEQLFIQVYQTLTDILRDADNIRFVDSDRTREISDEKGVFDPASLPSFTVTIDKNELTPAKEFQVIPEIVSSSTSLVKIDNKS